MCTKACCNKNENSCCEPEMTDCLAKKVECIWKKSFCDATLIPVIGIPSCTCGVMMLTHKLGKCIGKVQINGLKSNSPLANNEFYTAEVAGGQWLNLYKIMIPDVPGQCGCKSSAEVYTEALVKLGISVDAVYNNWTGSCPHMISINSRAIGMNPCEFSKKQICAIKAVLEYINGCCC